MSFYIGSKAPRTRRSQLRQVYSIARSYGLTSADLHEIASEILGRPVESISRDNGFTDEEMFVLWVALRSSSTVNIARYNSGSLDELFEELEEYNNSEAEEDDGIWPNF